MYELSIIAKQYFNILILSLTYNYLTLICSKSNYMYIKMNAGTYANIVKNLHKSEYWLFFRTINKIIQNGYINIYALWLTLNPRCIYV